MDDSDGGKQGDHAQTDRNQSRLHRSLLAATSCPIGGRLTAPGVMMICKPSRPSQRTRVEVHSTSVAAAIECISKQKIAFDHTRSDHHAVLR